MDTANIAKAGISKKKLEELHDEAYNEGYNSRKPSVTHIGSVNSTNNTSFSQCLAGDILVAIIHTNGIGSVDAISNCSRIGGDGSAISGGHCRIFRVSANGTAVLRGWLGSGSTWTSSMVYRIR